MDLDKTTNITNGKFYVGKDEKNDPNYFGSGKILKLAINKYGLEYFKKEILEECLSREELNVKEKYWIIVLSATTLGYNIAEGGTGGQTKFNKIYQFDKKGAIIKEWSTAAEITRTLGFDSSAILKVCKGILISCKGFIWSYEKTVKEFHDPRTIEILQYDRFGNFIKKWCSVIEVKNNLNISDRQIQLTLDKTNLTAKGFVWIRKNGEIKNKIIIPKCSYFNNKNAAKNNKTTKQKI